MNIKSTFTNRFGDTLHVSYFESDPYQDLEGKHLKNIHAYCFHKSNLILVNHPKSGWMPPGGGIEPEETVEEATIREVKEETNMNVLHQEVIGYQDVEEKDGKIIRQVRCLCIVEPHGEFVSNPDGEIMEIKAIDPSEYKQYFDWLQIGDRVMERALYLKRLYENELI
ncbi:MAG TPA: NUDIX hydrolase [Candidatus Paceibacterota bacterium]|nr:NUDIX hydrolase [Candidatus Paceibacterota bacterium]